MFDKKLQDRLSKSLRKSKETVAVAESVTAGLLQSAVGNAEYASDFFQGGITCYNLGQKFKHLGVEPIHAGSVNSVSRQVADEMATNVCTVFASDWGISITGYATPAPESNGKIFAYYSITYRKKIKAGGRLTSAESNPEKIQLDYVHQILRRLATLIK